jgi:hypothetical protein
MYVHGWSDGFNRRGHEAIRRGREEGFATFASPLRSLSAFKNFLPVRSPLQPNSLIDDAPTTRLLVCS